MQCAGFHIKKTQQVAPSRSTPQHDARNVVTPHSSLEETAGPCGRRAGEHGSSTPRVVERAAEKSNPRSELASRASSHQPRAAAAFRRMKSLKSCFFFSPKAPISSALSRSWRSITNQHPLSGRTAASCRRERAELLPKK